MGIVTDEPIITADSEQMNFTNEGGVGGKARFLKNITGMWILEQCRKEWSAQGHDYAYPSLVAMAETVTDVPELFNPDEPRFANPTSMIEQVTAGRDLTVAQITACIFHSLAKRYAEVFGMLCQLAPWEIGALYVIGGGARNAFLNRLTQEAIGVPVIVGAVEATALGNIQIQMQSVIKN
jgi:rhamnulokinase